MSLWRFLVVLLLQYFGSGNGHILRYNNILEETLSKTQENKSLCSLRLNVGNVCVVKRCFLVEGTISIEPSVSRKMGNILFF